MPNPHRNLSRPPKSTAAYPMLKEPKVIIVFHKAVHVGFNDDVFGVNLRSLADSYPETVEMYDAVREKKNMNRSKQERLRIIKNLFTVNPTTKKYGYEERLEYLLQEYKKEQERIREFMEKRGINHRTVNPGVGFYPKDYYISNLHRRLYYIGREIEFLTTNIAPFAKSINTDGAVFVHPVEYVRCLKELGKYSEQDLKDIAIVFLTRIEPTDTEETRKRKRKEFRQALDRLNKRGVKFNHLKMVLTGFYFDGTAYIHINFKSAQHVLPFMWLTEESVLMKIYRNMERVGAMYSCSEEEAKSEKGQPWAMFDPMGPPPPPDFRPPVIVVERHFLFWQHDTPMYSKMSKQGVKVTAIFSQGLTEQNFYVAMRQRQGLPATLFHEMEIEKMRRYGDK
ncbi:MAG: hypothetical protein RMM53_11160, partial [Bacteroidia bacterium]|nr:hypothetical protein [Bacteroidia bacterium]